MKLPAKESCTEKYEKETGRSAVSEKENAA